MLYKIKVYSITASNQLEYLGDGVVRKKILGSVIDFCSDFEYAAITQDSNGLVTGIRPKMLEICGQDLVVLKNELVPKNIAPSQFVEDYINSFFELSRIKEYQEDMINSLERYRILNRKK